MLEPIRGQFVASISVFAIVISSINVVKIDDQDVNVEVEEGDRSDVFGLVPLRKSPRQITSTASSTLTKVRYLFQAGPSHTIKSIGHNGVNITHLEYAGDRCATSDNAYVSEEGRNADFGTARDLTLEAARDAGASRKPIRQMPVAQIKRLLDSRNEREVLDGLRRAIAVSNGSVMHSNHTDVSRRCNIRRRSQQPSLCSPRSSRLSLTRRLLPGRWCTPSSCTMPKPIQTRLCSQSTRSRRLCPIPVRGYAPWLSRQCLQYVYPSSARLSPWPSRRVSPI